MSQDYAPVEYPKYIASAQCTVNSKAEEDAVLGGLAQFKVVETAQGRTVEFDGEAPIEPGNASSVVEAVLEEPVDEPAKRRKK